MSATPTAPAPAAAPAAAAPAPAADTSNTPNTPDTSQRGAGAEATAAEKAEARRVWKLKQRGQEVEFDPSDEDRTRSLVQRGLDADLTNAEMAKVRKHTEKLLKGLSSEDALEFLVKNGQKLGVDPAKLRAAAEKYLRTQIEDEMLTPEEREVRDLRRDKAERDAEKAKEAQTVAQREFTEKQQRFETAYTQKFSAALQQSGCPATPATLTRMAQLQLLANQHGIELTVEDLAGRVREAYETEHKHLYSNLDAKGLRKLLGDDAIKKLREEDIAEHRTRNANGTFAPKAGAPAAAAPAPAGGRQVIDRAAFMRDLKKGA